MITHLFATLTDGCTKSACIRHGRLARGDRFSFSFDSFVSVVRNEQKSSKTSATADCVLFDACDDTQNIYLLESRVGSHDVDEKCADIQFLGVFERLPYVYGRSGAVQTREWR